MIEENANIIPMFSAASVGVLLYPNSNRKYIYKFIFMFLESSLTLLEYLNIFPTDCKLMQIALKLIHIHKWTNLHSYYEKKKKRTTLWKVFINIFELSIIKLVHFFVFVCKSAVFIY